MKKIISLFVALVMVFVLTTGTQAQAAGTANDKAISVSLNGEKVQFGENGPIIEKGTTLVPARKIFETLGYDVSWDKENEVVLAEKYGLSVALQIGNLTAYINGIEVELAAAPKVYNNTTYVPLRFISETIGFNVEWQGATGSILLTKEYSKGYIWKVEKDGVEVHLLGSIHMGDEKMYPLRDEIEQAFDNSDHLVVEVNIAEGPDEKTAAEIQAMQVYSDGTTLKDHVSAETYARLQSFLVELDLPTNSYDTFKPWAIYLDMANYVSLSSGYQGGLGIDMYYLSRAQLANKPILELESYKSQLNIFDSYSKELQEQQVNEVLDGIFGITETTAETDTSLDALANLWIQGDDAGLEELVASVEESPELYEKLLTNRHTGMLEKIEGYLGNEKKESYFVVVGYLHMLGKDGLITQLKEKGYTVTRI
ncbi:MAG: TraB/GumN family protein [Candidatus Pristimantibacillus lignocellulolyticus]|uniref:TraB/GumN family protein n=1 Tax=Candidatus Pristimantibacillus lignocellulolyticus TaxID=2994561 RepID=A0A9J6ZH81_9BACL|nr:MAG: TraB/GumN family protein [Candidatus Pristimantibacillus lignocellulolyticus]